MHNHNNMIENNTDRKLIVRLIAAAIMIAAVLMLAGCSGGNGAEAKTAEDIESMRDVSLDQETEAELESMLSEEGREYLQSFLDKAGDFEYKITGSDDADDGSGEVIVHVRITSYDFASEYLKSWSEFLEGSSEAYDSAVLYETLFRNLSNVADKDYISEVDIKCSQDEEGEWTTDAKSNSALRNAILGGMISEISSLAGM